MTKISYHWQDGKLPYMEVFEHFANNWWSHSAWYIPPFLVYYSTHYNNLQVHIGLLL